jgi:hypothetical protein
MGIGKSAIHLAVAAAGLCLAPVSSEAQLGGVLGWMPLGEVHIDADGCNRAPCTLRIEPKRRHQAFSLSTDAPYGLVLQGKITVTCGDGSSVQVFLSMPSRLGLFQVFGNTCVRADLRSLDLEVAGAQLRDEDKEMGVTLTLFGNVT